MPPDIKAFVERRIAELIGTGLEIPTLAPGAAAAEARKFRQAFGRDLPATYLDIRPLCDGFTDANMARLHGLQTAWAPGEEYPDREGILHIHEEHQLAGTGREDFIELANQDGVEPWGWDLSLARFIRSDPNPATGAHLAAFDTFEDMFRALFRLGP